ncbi:MAG: DUF6541 family protein [Actinomycetales bacterium]
MTRLVVVLVAVLPGALLGFALPAGRYRWLAWASAPVLTLGLLSFGMAWLGGLGLPNSPLAVLVVESALAVVLPLALRAGPWWQARQAPTDGTAATAPPGTGRRVRAWVRRQLPGVPDLAGVSAAALVVLAFGHVLIGRFRYPTAWDSMNHAILTRNMLERGGTAVSDACRTGWPDGKVSCTFYPLAADISWGQAVQLTGGRISTAMLTWAAILGPLILVPALYAAVRMLGGRPLVATCAAALPAVVGPLWAQQVDGRVTGAIPGLSITVALLTALALRGRHPVRLGLLAGIGLAGLVMVHTYDALFAGTAALALFVFLGGRVRVRRLLLGAAAVAAGAVACLAPLVPALLGANGERAAVTPKFLGRFPAAFHYWVTDPQRYAPFSYPDAGGRVVPTTAVVSAGMAVVMTALVLSFASFGLAQLRWVRPWVLLAVLWTAIGIWTTTSQDAVAQALAHLWYGGAPRLRDMVFPCFTLMVVAGACVAGLAVERAWRRVRTGSGRWVAWLPSTAATVVVVLLLALGTVPNASASLRTSLGVRTPRSSAYPRVFAWLHRHTAKNEVVIYNRNYEWMPWSYGDYGTKGLFGIGPFDPVSKADIAKRWMVWQFLINKPDTPPDGCVVRQFDIEYLVTGPRHVPSPVSPEYRHPNAGQSPYLRLVHVDGGLRVYRITEAGRACAGA